MENNEEKKPVTQELKVVKSSGSIYSNIDAFNDGQRIAKALAGSTLVPAAYQNNLPNTMIALEIANRINISPFMVMQNLDIIKGKPSWSSTFIIAALNSSGRFSPLRFRFEGDKNTDDYGCRAVATDLDSKELLRGPLVDWRMVKAEGWLDKSGSKWKTMPELMFHYRSASFFGRLYAPDILKGMHSMEENIDIAGDIASKVNASELDEIKAFLNDESIVIPEEERMNIERIVEQKEEASYRKALEFFKKLSQ